MALFGLFGSKAKRRSLPVPPPPKNLPTFPSPKDLDEEQLLSDSDDGEAIEEMSESFDEPMNRVSNVGFGHPVFLKLNVFQSVLDDIHSLRGSLDKAKKMVSRMEDVHESQSDLLKKWHHTMKDTHEKLLFVDGVLFRKR